MGLYPGEEFQYRVIIRNKLGTSTIILARDRDITRRFMQSSYYIGMNTEERKDMIYRRCRIWTKPVAIDVNSTTILSAEERDRLAEILRLHGDNVEWHGFYDIATCDSTLSAPIKRSYRVLSGDSRIHQIAY